jgi:DHA1 family multidrug resistance protein-like MFS transporter
MKNIKLMIAAAFVLYFLNGLLGPLLVVFIEKIGGENLLNIGYVYATFLITSGVFSAVSGKLSDKYGRKKLILLGALVATSVPFGYIFVTNVYHILFLEFVLGISLGINFAPYFALFSESSKKVKRGMHFGLFDLMTSLASAIAILVGVYIVQFFGFVNLFLIMGILSFVNFLILLMIKDL